MILSVADVRTSAGRRTITSEVVKMLQSFGIRLAVTSSAILDRVSQVEMNIISNVVLLFRYRRLEP